MQSTVIWHLLQTPGNGYNAIDYEFYQFNREIGEIQSLNIS